MSDRVTVIVPSRNEKFLHQTVRDVLGQARGDVECIVALDGYWTRPDQEHLPSDPRLHLLHRGDAVGMRDNINAAAAIATGRYLMKLDAHCKLAEGYDVELAKHCDEDQIVVPRRYALDPEAWAYDHSNPKYPIDYHFLSNPIERPDDPHCGLHGENWKARRDERKHLMVDEEMSSQGSCWFMHTAHFRDRIGTMDSKTMGPFITEMQELGLKTQLAGGMMKTVKSTEYAHLYKGRKYGRGYALGPNQFGQAKAVVDYWMRDQWPGAIHPLKWLIERFWPVPTWGDDPERVFYCYKKGIPWTPTASGA